MSKSQPLEDTNFSFQSNFAGCNNAKILFKQKSKNTSVKFRRQKELEICSKIRRKASFSYSF